MRKLLSFLLFLISFSYTIAPAFVFTNPERTTFQESLEDYPVGSFPSPWILWFSGAGEEMRIKIVNVDYPTEVYVDQSFSIDVIVDYSFTASTDVMIQVYEHAGPLLAYSTDVLSGKDQKTYSFTLTAPPEPKTWQLNIHAFYWKDGEWVQDDIKSIKINVVEQRHECKLEITDVYIEPYPVRVGDEFRIGVGVRNVGSSSVCISPHLDFYIEWSPGDSLKAHPLFCGTPPQELPPGEEMGAEYCGSLEALKPGLVTLRITVSGCIGHTPPGGTCCLCESPEESCTATKEYDLNILVKELSGDIWTNKGGQGYNQDGGSFQVGEAIKIYFEVSSAAYVKVYDEFPNGTWKLLGEGQAEPGTTYQIPGVMGEPSGYRIFHLVGPGDEILDSCYVEVTAAGQPPSLTLYEPEIDGLTVTVNGVTTPGTPGASIIRLHWDWGDGHEEDHWFPASHTYAEAGTYTITVTSYQSDGLSTTKSITVTVSALNFVKFRGTIQEEPPNQYDVIVRIDEVLSDPKGKLDAGDLAHIDIADYVSECDVHWPLHKGDKVEVYAKHYEYDCGEYAVCAWIYSRDHKYDGYVKLIEEEELTGDIWTNKGGQGPNQDGGSFEVGELVKIYFEVSSSAAYIKIYSEFPNGTWKLLDMFQAPKPGTTYRTEQYMREPAGYRIFHLIGPEGQVLDSCYVEVLQANEPPVAILEAWPTSVNVNEQVNFDASSSYDPDGQVVSYYFDFGDGHTSGWTSQSSVSHSYSEPGNYYAKVKVKDDDGAESDWSSSVKIEVKANVGIVHVHVVDEKGTTIKTARIYLDGVEKGDTEDGWMTLHVAPGHHKVKAVRYPYEGEEEFDIEAGETKEITLVLKLIFDFSLSASPPSQKVEQGGSASYDVQARLESGTPKTVHLSVTGLPPGTTYFFNPESGEPSFSSKLTITTSKETPKGTYMLTIRGESGGKERTITVTLIVEEKKPKPEAEIKRIGVFFDRTKFYEEWTSFRVKVIVSLAKNHPSNRMTVELLFDTSNITVKGSPSTKSIEGVTAPEFVFTVEIGDIIQRKLPSEIKVQYRVKVNTSAGDTAEETRTISVYNHESLRRLQIDWGAIQFLYNIQLESCVLCLKINNKLRNEVKTFVETRWRDIRDKYELAREICNWVQGAIKYDNSSSSRQPTYFYMLWKQIKEEGYGNVLGDCTDYAILFVGMCRAVGIKARFVSSVFFSYGIEEERGHDFAEVYIKGNWIHADPTNGKFDAPYEFEDPGMGEYKEAKTMISALASDFTDRTDYYHSFAPDP